MATANWVGTWITPQQLVETANNPPVAIASSTLRQVVHVSIGGSRLRLRFSNEYGTSSVTMNEVHLANFSGGNAINTATDTKLTFSGSASVTMAAKGFVYSDPFDFALDPLSDVTISIYYGAASKEVVTGHPGSRTTSYIQSGNAAASAALTWATTEDHWYTISSIDVVASTDTHAVVILGDSLTDGRGSDTNKNNRWPDDLARRLQANASTKNVAVLNQGVGGNCVDASCGLGTAATNRFNQDVLNQAGVKWLIIWEGVNDIGNSSSSSVVNALEADFAQLIAKAKTANIKVYGVTISPIKGHSYYTTDHEAQRQSVNAWLLGTNATFDGVFDADKLLRDPAAPDTLVANYSSDGLHLTVPGYQLVADSIPLTWFQ